MTPEALTENRKQVREEFTVDSQWRLLRDPTGEGDPNYFAINGGIGCFDNENPQGFHLTGFIPEADARKIAAAKEMYEALKASEREYENFDERAPVDSGCIECTFGTVPNRLNTGLCAHHLRKAAIALAEAGS